MRKIAGIDNMYCNYDDAEVLLQSIPYDGTSTWGKGANRGFAAFLVAKLYYKLLSYKFKYNG